MPQVFYLKELDSDFAPVQVKKEPSKPSTASKPVASSKATAMPKPYPATKPRASSSRKRKETDSPATSKAFPYENHRFLESSGFMTSFLNQGLERLTKLYEEACGVNKMLEAKLKNAETTIADQGMIVTIKSQNYEDKFKEVTLEAHISIKKANQDAQAKLDAAQLQHEQDMNSYREGLKGSVVISLLLSRLKMVYKAKAMGFECPSWNIDAWEAKLKDLDGNPVEYPANHETGASSKAAEVVAEAGGEAGKDPMVKANAGAGGDGEAAVEGATA
ncbi:hypothetical protein HanPI659440_Chr03g0116531 [Helianthus annuus]|nr:hypothetical protein HanPI659440_Chr03g0116531 [Helianthus annuus]